MDYRVFYITRWFRDIRFCGEFTTLHLAYDYVEFLQHKLPNGTKIVFKIESGDAGAVL